jgi:hypothetical protein
LKKAKTAGVFINKTDHLDNWNIVESGIRYTKPMWYEIGFEYISFKLKENKESIFK